MHIPVQYMCAYFFACEKGREKQWKEKKTAHIKRTNAIHAKKHWYVMQ